MKYLRLIFVAIIFLISVTTLILGGLYFYRKTERKTLSATDRKLVAGSFIKLNAGFTHYQLSASDTGQVVVLLNSFTTPYYVWDSTYNYLIKHGCRVLRYDPYGCGYSDRPDSTYNNALYYNQLRQLIKALNLPTPVSLVGLAFGGAVATGFTIKYPDLINKVTLINPNYENVKPDKPEFIARYYETIHPNERAESQLNNFKHPENYRRDWLSKYRVQMQYRGFINALVSTMYNYDYDGRKSNQLLHATHKPVLLIWGRDDERVSFSYTDSIRNLLKPEFFPVDDAGHFANVDQPGVINPRILKFLEE
jgi:pimeloyl-ACP methyl ester carboxylesterase